MSHIIHEKSPQHELDHHPDFLRLRTLVTSCLGEENQCEFVFCDLQVPEGTSIVKDRRPGDENKEEKSSLLSLRGQQPCYNKAARSAGVESQLSHFLAI